MNGKNRAVVAIKLAKAGFGRRIRKVKERLMEGTKQELERTLENKKITKEEYDCRINDAEFEARAQIEQSICSMGSQGECLALRVKDPFLAEQLIPDAQDISDLLN